MLQGSNWWWPPEVHVPSRPAKRVTGEPGMPCIEGLSFRLFFEFKKRMVLREVDVTFTFLVQAVDLHLDALLVGHFLQAFPKDILLSAEHVEEPKHTKFLILREVPRLRQRFCYPLGEGIFFHRCRTSRRARHDRAHVPGLQPGYHEHRPASNAPRIATIRRSKSTRTPCTSNLSPKRPIGSPNPQHPLPTPPPSFNIMERGRTNAYQSPPLSPHRKKAQHLYSHSS